ncbi:MAG TPA: molybdopterin oxidoreductase [Polyangiaceae bacterium]
MNETPKFIQGVFTFRGAGLARPAPLTPAAIYKVPFDKRAQLIYLRAGNATSELVYLVLNRGGKSMRLFPLGAKAAIHVPLSIVEDIDPESDLELCVGAPEGLEGALVIDMGVLEI